MRKKIKSLFVLSISTLLLSTTQSLAQNASDFILKGKIQDDQGYPIEEASIQIIGTTKGAYTDSAGFFSLQLKKQDVFQCRIAALGFKADTIKLLTKNWRQDSLWTIQLSNQQNQLAEVRVISQQRRLGSLTELYLEQKNMLQFSNGVSAEQIQKTPDAQAADVLKRVSGVHTQDEKFVVVRGLASRYNYASLNQSRLPSTEADKNAFAFDILPAAVLDKIVVYKTASPQWSAEFAGGLIEAKTKEYPLEKIQELSLSTTFNSITSFQEFRKNPSTLRFKLLGVLAQDKQLPSIYYQHKDNLEDLSADKKVQLAHAFTNPYGEAQKASSIGNVSLTYTLGNSHYLKKDRRLGYIFSVNVQNGTSKKNATNAQYDFNKNALDSNGVVEYQQKSQWSVLANVNYQFNPKNKIAFRNLFYNTGAQTVGLVNGVTYGGGNPYFLSNFNKTQQNGFLNNALSGSHQINTKSELDWNIAHSYTYTLEPDKNILTLVQKEDSSYYRKLNNENSPIVQDAGRVFSKQFERVLQSQVNYKYTFNWFKKEQSIKVGLSTIQRAKDVSIIALGYASTNPYGEFINVAKPDFNSVFNASNIDNYQLTLAKIGNNSVSYQGFGQLYEAYTQLENSVSNKLKVLWGARAAYNMQEVKIDQVKEVLQKINMNILPSALVSYSVNDQSQLRMGASQTLNRPEFRELVATNIYDYSTNFIFKGNAQLEACKISNFDLKYELYPKADEVISVGVFYKSFANPIEQINLGNKVFSYQNSLGASLYGLEMEFRKNLDFIPGSLFKHLNVYVNGSILKGNVQLDQAQQPSLMQGQAPYLINTGLQYQHKSLGANIVYHKTGTSLAFRGIGTDGMDIYEKPRDVIDLQISKSFFNNKWELKFSLNDILAQPYTWYATIGNKQTENFIKKFNNETDKVINQFQLGTNAKIAIKYKF